MASFVLVPGAGGQAHRASTTPAQRRVYEHGPKA
jgi:hypothetical protein